MSEFEPLPYDQFIAERQKLVDARARGQQRIDQIVTGGAAGALVLSITFLEKIAFSQHSLVWTLLVASWLLLLLSLALSLLAHYVGCQAFESQIQEFDEAYIEERRCRAINQRTRLAQILDYSRSIIFVIGIAFLACFAIINVRLTLSERAMTDKKPLPTPARPQPSQPPSPPRPSPAPRRERVEHPWTPPPPPNPKKQ